MPSYLKYLLLLVFLAITGRTGMAIATAQELDPHQIYERSCGNCHAPHAGDFVQESTDYRDGALVGRVSGREVRTLLAAGHGRLSAEEIKVLVDHLTRVRLSGQIYRDKCGICHDRAVQLARLELILRDGVLTGRYTGRDIEEFFLTHGRLTDDELPKMIDTLKYQLESAQ